MRSHVLIWSWMQNHHLRNMSYKRNSISEYMMGEALLKVGSEYMRMALGRYLWRPKIGKFSSKYMYQKKRMCLSQSGSYQGESKFMEII